MRVAAGDVRTRAHLIDLAVADRHCDEHAEPDAHRITLAHADCVAIADADRFSSADSHSDATTRDPLAHAAHRARARPVLRRRRRPHAGARLRAARRHRARLDAYARAAL